MHLRSIATPGAGTRHLVLGAAFALGLACWLLPQTHVVRAAAIGGRIVVAQAGDDPCRLYPGGPGAAGGPGSAGRRGRSQARRRGTGQQPRRRKPTRRPHPTRLAGTRA